MHKRPFVWRILAAILATTLLGGCAGSIDATHPFKSPYSSNSGSSDQARRDGPYGDMPAAPAGFH